jgi:hypothetical protein
MQGKTRELRQGQQAPTRTAIHHGLVLLLIAAGLGIAVIAASHLFYFSSILYQNFGSITWLLLGLIILSGNLCILALAIGVRRWIRGEWARASMAPFRTLFYLIFLGTLIKFVLFPPFHMTLFYFTLTFSFGLFALFFITARWFFSFVPRPVINTTDLVLLNACLICIAGELGLRILSRFYSSPLLVRTVTSAEQKVDFHRYPAGTMRFGFPCNQKGHYDTAFEPKKKEENLVVTIGDSFSLGVVPHHFHFTTVCERMLQGYNIYNMGVCAIGPPEYLYLLRQEALPLNPDLIIINLFIGNDFGDNLRDYSRVREAGKAFQGAVRSWFDLENILIYLIPRRIAMIAREEEELAHGLDALQGERPEEEVEISLNKVKKGLFPWLDDPLKEAPYFSKATFLDIERVRAETVCKKNKDLYEKLFSTILRMKEAARGTDFAVMVIPDEFQIEDGLWNEILTLSTIKNLDRYLPQQVLTQWLDQQKIPYLNLLPRLIEAPPLDDGKKHLYHLRNTHFNARGNELTGIALAEFVASLIEK